MVCPCFNCPLVLEDEFSSSCSCFAYLSLLKDKAKIDVEQLASFFMNKNVMGVSVA